MPFLLVRNDITNMQVDAIVNPSNTELKEGAGTSRAIFLAAGEMKLAKACAKIGYCAPGDAVVTKGYDLDAKYIIHAVGPVWRGGSFGEREMLYSAYTSSLKRARECGADSVAFPLLSAGTYGYPKDQALRVAMSAITDFLMENDMLIYLVLYDRQALSVSQKVFQSVEEYIDDHYVNLHDEVYRPKLSENRRFSNYREMEYDRDVSYNMSDFEMPAMQPHMADDTEKKPGLFRKKKKRSLDDLMDHMGETFSQMLLRLIDEKGYTDSQVYHRANIDRRHFSKIRNNVNYVPNKKTAIAFAIALELSSDEAKDLLNTAGFTFSDSSKFDVIVRYFLENKNYNVFDINEVLFMYEQPLIGE